MFSKCRTTLLSVCWILPIALSSTVFASALNEQQQQQLMQLKSVSLEASTAFDIVESLTTEVGARMVGTPGQKKSEAWAQAKMHELGFDKVWTEEVTSVKWHRGEVSAQITAPYPQKLVALALGGSVGTNGNTLQAHVAHFDTLDDLQAAEDNSLNGKIVFVSYKMQRHIDGDGYGKAVGARVVGAVVAAQKGASAFVMRSVGTDTNRHAHTGVMRYQEGVEKIPAVAISNPDADLLVRQIKRGQSVTMALNLSAGNNIEEVKALNVIGEITGSEAPQEVVVMGAHLDSWDVGTGAIDDGVGVGITLAAVKHILDLPQRPKRSIRVILFAAEEVGLHGAKGYVDARDSKLADHVIGAEWDFGNGKIYKLSPGVGPSALNTIRELAEYLSPMGVALTTDNIAKGQSDMSALGNLGMPAINFNPDGNDYFDYHHTENDTLDKVDQHALKHNTAVYTMFAYFAAQSAVNFRQ
ncbi:M20/M25/M40 family metallo-hydrolase [Alteromonadaceae bacterium BrNp21-10]|nr:M20/M25/M40 family metallo-hydrolase [Alteromonadaceae bacterium BrNp21-10]